MPESMEMGRRDFLRVASAAAVGVSLNGKAAEEPAPRTGPGLRAEWGEPYGLDGHRLYFQNWHYVHPGEFEWNLPDGTRVRLEDSTPPGGAFFRHKHQPFGIQLRALPAARLGPLLQAEQPWEENAGVAFTTILQDGGRYRAWGSPFTTSGDPPGQSHFTYFESDDGLAWRRPKLGIVDFAGSKSNNIVNIFGVDGATVFIDPSAPAGERYKLVAQTSFDRPTIDGYLRRRAGAIDPKIERKPDGSAKGMCGAVSADGLHWKQIREPLVLEVTDTQLTAYFDEHLRSYVAYTRTWAAGRRSSEAPPGARRAWGNSRRSIGRSESRDFREFPLHETILEPGPDLLPTDTLYTNGRTSMPGAPDHHLLFPTVWRTFGDTTAVALASSHDGENWHFLKGSPVFEPGPFGAFDGGCVFAHPNLVELPDGNFVLPYTGYNVPHKYPRRLWKFAPGYLVWPKGRMAALEAPGLGEFSTVALVPPGRKLRLNALVKRGGAVRVEAAAADGTPIPGRTFAQSRLLTGDLFWAPVTWGDIDDLGMPDKAGLVLRFRLDQAQIYGLVFI